MRTVYERFQTIERLAVDAVGAVLEKEARRQPVVDFGRSRAERLRAAVDAHARTIGRLLPLRSVIREHFGDSHEIGNLLDRHTLDARDRVLAFVVPELAGQTPEQRRVTALIVDGIFSTETWERLCCRDGLSEAAAQDLCLAAFDSIIPVSNRGDGRLAANQDMSLFAPTSLAR